MKRELTIIPQISIHPGQINIYNQYHWDPSPPPRPDTGSDYFCHVNEDGSIFEVKGKKYNHLLDSDRTANGKISKIAERKIKKAVDYTLAVTTEKRITDRITGRTIKMKLAFITLTLPSTQIHTDKEIIAKLLNQFLIEIKKYYHVKNYIWRAEKQVNGNIHFHILIDKFIPYQELRDRWNRITEKLGYVTRYRAEQTKWHEKGFRVRTNLLKTWCYEKQKQAYERGSKQHWHSPNSTDIHSLQKIINIKSYITKYITKKPKKSESDRLIQLQEIRKNNKKSLKKVPAKNRKKIRMAHKKRLSKIFKFKQTGRVWGCNRELNNLKGARLDIDNQTGDELQKLENNRQVYKFKGDYFQIYYIDWKKLPSMGCDYLFQQLSLYLHEVFDTPIQQTISP